MFIDHAHFQALTAAASRNYRGSFHNLGAGQSLPPIGMSEPKDPQGNLLYTDSLTPTQKRQAISVTILVVGVLSAVGFVLAAYFLAKPTFYYALFASGALIIGGTIASCHYCSLLDLESPKRRANEIKLLKEKALTLRQLADRYENIAQIASYALLGEASHETYKTVITLCSQVNRAKEIFRQEKARIENLYQQAIAPARHHHAQVAQMATMGQMAGTTMLHSKNIAPKILGAGVVTFSAYEAGRADAQLQMTQQQLLPHLNRALASLRDAYYSAINPLETNFKSLHV